MSKPLDPRRKSRPALLLLLALGLTPGMGCAPESEPLLGVAAPRSSLAVAEMALRDAILEGWTGLPQLALEVEESSRSGSALQVAERLVNRPGLVAVVGHSNSATSVATARVYNQQRVVQIAPTSTAPIYSELGEYSFRLVPPDPVQGRTLVAALEALRPEGARVAVMYVNDDYGRGLRPEVLSRLDPARHPVVLDLPHNDPHVEPFDPAHQAGALVASSPDAILWLGRLPPLEILLPHIRSSLGGILIIGGDDISRAAVQHRRVSWWRGVYFLDFVDMNSTPELREFQDRWWEWRGEGGGGAEALTYDATRLIMAAVADGARTGSQVREWLQSLGRSRPPFQGLTGPVQFDEWGDVSREYVVLRLTAEGVERGPEVGGGR